MNFLTKIFSTFRSQLRGPKVYAIVFKKNDRSQDLTRLDMQVAFSMEEAISIAQKAYAEKTKEDVSEIVGFWKPIMWHHIDVSEILNEATEISSEEEEIPETGDVKKNELMKKIIETKDEKLLSKNLKKFKEHEIAYLRERL
jgi:hypothetical protein